MHRQPHLPVGLLQHFHHFMYVTLSCNSAWVVGTYVIWAHANRKSELCKKGRGLGKYRAAVDVAEAIMEELGPDICAYKDEESEKTIKSRPPTTYFVSPSTLEELEADYVAHIGLPGDKGERAVRLNYGQVYGQLQRRDQNLTSLSICTVMDSMKGRFLVMLEDERRGAAAVFTLRFKMMSFSKS